MFTLFALWVSFALAIGHHLEDNPSTSVPILDTFPEAFSLVPVNLYPEEDIVGPISLNAVNFITLGIPLSSKSGDVTVESFLLADGYLSEQSGLQVSFSPVSENELVITDSSVLKAGESPEPSTFGVDLDGYLVSVTPLIVSDGSYVADRIKFFACPNKEQDNYGGGEYKVFSNNAPDPEKCLPIYLGVTGNETPLPHLNKNQQSGSSPPAPAPAPAPPCDSCETHEIITPLVTQIWDGQVQSPPAPSPTAPGPAPVQPAPAPHPSSPPGPRPVPAPPPTTSKYSPPQLPLVTQIGDGQVWAPTATPSPAPAPYVPVPAPVPYPPRPAPPAPASTVFQGSGMRIAFSGFPQWTGVLVLVAIRLIL